MLLYLQFEVTHGWVLEKDMEIAPCGVVFVSFNRKKEYPELGKAKTILF